MDAKVAGLEQHTADLDCLAGVRVIDLTQYEAGPSCTEALAWLGAEVVKIERPGTGEPARYGYARVADDKDSWYFCQFNANKKSVNLDLKSDRGLELVKQLISEADVFIENLAPGAIERLGLGYDVLREINPKLIYAQVKGFGEGSHYENFLSYDPIAQASGGILSVTGERGGPPCKPGPGIGDTGTGMTLTISMLGALYRAARTGQGQRLQVAMQDSCMSYIRLAWAYTLHTGDACRRQGAKGVNGTTVPQGVYPTKGGGPNDYIILYCHPSVPEQFQRLLDIIGRPDLKGDPDYISQAARAGREEEVNEMIAKWSRTRTKEEAMEIIGEARIPVGTVRDTRDLYDDPSFEQRGLMQEIDHPTLGSFKMVGWPVRHDGAFAEVRPAPLNGANTEDVFASWLGMDSGAVAKLREDGIV
ncbi:MAG: hypothetical protein HKN60_00430 [Rhizobiales bacterium]|nr:hypothetical protein [Hyphomicrobiales bacterium]